MHWGNGGITPYNMYDNWLDHTLVQGANTNGDFGRLNSPQVQTISRQSRLTSPAAPSRSPTSSRC